MAVRIYLGGHLNFYHPNKESWLEIELVPPDTIKSVLERANIPLGEVYLAVVNGEIVTLDTLIAESDAVKVYSAVGGG